MEQNNCSDVFSLMSNESLRSSAWPDVEKVGPFGLYYYLRSYIIRKEDIHVGKINIGKDYYSKGKLVAKWHQIALAEYFKVTERHIRNVLNTLESLGYIKILKVVTGKYAENIYQFGYVNDKGIEVYFIDLEIAKNKEAKLKEIARQNLLENGIVM